MSSFRKIVFVSVILLVLTASIVAAVHIVPAVEPGALVAAGQPMVDDAEMGSIPAMTRAQLKRFLHDRDVRCVGCMDRDSLVETAVQSAHLPTHTDNVIGELTPLQVADVNKLAEAIANPVQVTFSGVDTPNALPTGEVFEIVCSTPAGNGTAVCYSASAVKKHAAQSARF